MYSFIAQLLDPYTLLLLSLGCATAWVWWRSPRPRRRSLSAAGVLIGLLAILSMPIVGDFALGSLEWPYPEAVESPLPSDTIVVLGGSLIYEDVAGERVRLGYTSFARCHHAAQLYRKSGRCRIVLAGGRIDPAIPGPTLAAAMRDLLIELGVREGDLVLEDKSTTTYENALNVKPILEADRDARVWLVTEAMHMRRSEMCFRALGLRVTPAPCDHHALPTQFKLARLLPSSRGIARFDQAAHEWLGIAWYWLRGRI